jgi:putative tricarboxylic transport membrane protein
VKGLERSGDFWSGIVLASLGAYVVSQAWRWDYLTEEGPGAGFFPLWYGGAMIVLSVVLIAATAMKPVRGRAVNRHEIGRAVACWLAFVACIALMAWAGFVVAFALLTWFIVKVMAGESHLKAVVAAAGFALGFYALFELGLDLSLPRGVLF